MAPLRPSIFGLVIPAPLPYSTVRWYSALLSFAPLSTIVCRFYIERSDLCLSNKLTIHMYNTSGNLPNVIARREIVNVNELQNLAMPGQSLYGKNALRHNTGGR